MFKKNFIKRIYFTLILSALMLCAVFPAGTVSVPEFANRAYQIEKIDEKMSLVSIDTVIDLDEPHDNFFYASGIMLLNRFYYKIGEKDFEFLIQNISGDRQIIKKYFASKALSKLDDIKNAPDGMQKYGYVPEKESGLFFCLQKVRYDASDYREYFQIFNIKSRKVICVDFERSVLINCLESVPFKISVYLSNGKLLEALSADNAGFLKIKNGSYKELFVFNRDRHALYRARLNQVKKNDYAVFACYENTGTSLIRISGMITYYGFIPVKDFSKIDINVKISGRDNIVYWTKKIDNIQKDGSFTVDAARSAFFNQELKLSFYAGSALIREYIMDLNYTADQGGGGGMAVLENTVFNNNPAEIIIDKNTADKIETLNCSVTYSGRTSAAQVKKRSSERFDVLLPSDQGEYIINAELIFKNGDSLKKSFSISKIDLNAANGNIRTTVTSSGNFTGGIIEFNNPFTEGSCFHVLYGKDVIYFSNINFKSGKNIVKYDTGLINSVNVMSAVYIYDIQSGCSVIISNDLSTSSAFKKINADISAADGRVKININDKDLPQIKNMYINFLSESASFDKYLLKSFYSFNSFDSPQLKSERIYPGRFITVDQKNMKELEGISLNTAVFNACLFMNSGGKIYRCEKKVVKKNIIDVKITGPAVFYFNDQPGFTAELINNSGRDIVLEAVITSSSGSVINDNFQVSIAAGQKQTVSFFIKDAKYDSPVDVNVKIAGSGIKYADISRRFYAVRDYENNFVEMNGKIITDKKSSSYVSLPRSASGEYNIELFVSPSKYINLFKKNPIVNDYDFDIFEIELNRYLEEYAENIFFKTGKKADFADKYYVEGKGFKNRPDDIFIDIDATLLYLLADDLINIKTDKIAVNAVLNSIASERRNDILKSDFRIFALSECGVFFDEITAQFLIDISSTDRALFYFNYYKKHKMVFKDKLMQSGIVYRYGNYALSGAVTELLKLYFKLSSAELESINTGPFLIEDIIANLMLIGEIKAVKPKDSVINLAFESKELDSFSVQLKNNQMIYKKYSFKYQAVTDNDVRLINLNFTKDGDSPVYYMIRADFKDEDQVIVKNNYIDLNTQWLDEAGAVMNSGDLKFKSGRNYRINLIINSSKNEKELLLKLIGCDALKADKSSILVNNQPQTLKFLDDRHLILKNINKGVNIITISVKALYPGIYNAGGFEIVNLNDYRYLIKQNKIRLNIEK